MTSQYGQLRTIKNKAVIFYSPQKKRPQALFFNSARVSVFFTCDTTTKTLLELVDTPASVHNFLLASIKRVTL